MDDYRISVEEFESHLERLEMIRNLVRDALQQLEEFEQASSPLTLTEEENVPLLNKLK